MRELLDEVLSLQPGWTHKNTAEMQQRGLLIRQQIPKDLTDYTAGLQGALGAAGADLALEGRDGTGQKSEIPWVRIYSESRSASAHEGWYCVYLFRADGSGVYLCLEHASTRYQNGEFVPRPPEELASLVSWARSVIKPALDRRDDLGSEITLGARGPLGPAYERGTVCCKFYRAMAIPTDAVLINDLTVFASLLGRLYDADDLGRSPENLSPEARAAVELTEAVAAPLRSRLHGGQGFGLTVEERRVVERHAMKLAQAHLVRSGYKVRDVSSAEPYDFVATREDESLIVEVKGTTGTADSIVLTANEVNAHRNSHPKNALIIVHSIDLDRSQRGPKANGGVLFALMPWSIDDSALRPLSFAYFLQRPHTG